MEFLQNLFDSSPWPVLSAFLLGLMTAISPCPLATNITAIAYISKDIQNRNRVFVNGLIYTLGRAVSYTTLGGLLFLGASQFQIARLFQGWGERLLGPLLIVFGLLLLDLFKLNFPGMSRLTDKAAERGRSGFWGMLLVGMVFALAFCPYSGVLYFGMLIPMSISSPNGLLLPAIFALATGLPVMLFAWLLAYTVSGVGTFYNKIKAFEFWFRKVVAVIFILTGLYFLIVFWF
jgi:cytochrome c biogenesis protein CcdA